MIPLVRRETALSGKESAAGAALSSSISLAAGLER
jgi:hypothetical protein